jgi:septal ring factor EnvC (AmiA/AmiB activator)
MRCAHHPKQHLSRRRTRRGDGLLAAAVLATWLVTPAMAQDTNSQQLEDVERALELDRSRAEALAQEAEALKLEIRMLRNESIAAARQAQSREDHLSEIEVRLATLERQETVTRNQLRGRHQQLTGTLAALQRIALVPPDAL